jgi:ElaB/YqjD/DUF883 family membrane-anchored ribosome-binding protein
MNTTEPEVHTPNENAGEHLLEDAQALLKATAHVAEEKVIHARRRLQSALEKGREALATAQAKAVAGAKATDKIVRTHPYQAIGIALGVGLLTGYLLGRRNHRD